MILAVRRGKSTGAIAVSLFLLSCLLAVPFSWWAFAPVADPSLKREFTFAKAYRREVTSNERDSIAEDLKIKAWHHVGDQRLAQFTSVFWEPRDTISLREWISSSSKMEDARVLEIGTGTGLIAIACAMNGARRVVATDINPNAYANAAYNAERLGLDAQIECRLVALDTPGPLAVIKSDERFDFIISNPPWEDAKKEGLRGLAAHALYDPGFALLDAILSEAGAHLRPDGRVLLAYGAKTAIVRIQSEAPKYGWKVNIRDERELSDLPEVFVPAVLLELTRE